MEVISLSPPPSLLPSYPPWEKKKALLGAPRGESSHGALIRMAVIVFHHRAPVSAKYDAAFQSTRHGPLVFIRKFFLIVSPAVLHHGSSLRNAWRLYTPPYVQDYWQAGPVRQPARALRWQLEEASACGTQVSCSPPNSSR